MQKYFLELNYVTQGWGRIYFQYLICTEELFGGNINIVFEPFYKTTVGSLNITLHNDGVSDGVDGFICHNFCLLNLMLQ